MDVFPGCIRIMTDPLFGCFYLHYGGKKIWNCNFFNALKRLIWNAFTLVGEQFEIITSRILWKGLIEILSSLEEDFDISNALKWLVWSCFTFTMVEKILITRKGYKGTSGNKKDGHVGRKTAHLGRKGAHLRSKRQKWERRKAYTANKRTHLLGKGPICRRKGMCWN